MKTWQRLFWGLLGAGFFVLAMVGVVLPVLPTTPFLLLTAGCWAKSSPKFHAWLISHPTFGKLIQDWQQKGAIPRYAKLIAVISLTASSALVFYRMPADKLWLAWSVTGVCVLVAIWLVSRPSA